jgi:hypothetical protein
VSTSDGQVTVQLMALDTCSIREVRERLEARLPPNLASLALSQPLRFRSRELRDDETLAGLQIHREANLILESAQGQVLHVGAPSADSQQLHPTRDEHVEQKHFLESFEHEIRQQLERHSEDMKRLVTSSKEDLTATELERDEGLQKELAVLQSQVTTVRQLVETLREQQVAAAGRADAPRSPHCDMRLFLQGRLRKRLRGP